MNKALSPKQHNRMIAWEVAYEIMIRSSEPLLLFIIHPCDGQYDCLALLNNFREGPVMMVNLYGSSIVISRSSDIIDGYLDLYLKDKESLISLIAIKGGIRLEKKPIRALAAIHFLLCLVRNGVEVTSAWYSSSSGSQLCDAARCFQGYPHKESKDSSIHLKWWVISTTKETIGVCNVETGETILKSGNVLNVKQKGSEDLINQLSNLQEWNDAVMDTKVLLASNTEWIERYRGYAEKISKNKEMIIAVRRSFREWDPLKLYINISNAKSAGKHVRFDLRFLGQTVAELRHISTPSSLSKGNQKPIPIVINKMKLTSTSYADKNLNTFKCSVNMVGEDWDDLKAREFRKHFKTLAANGHCSNPGNEEHRFESLILTEMSKTTGKVMKGMKPVLIGGLRFPMPTPLHASNHKTISYANHYGGGIDIFARAGTGGVNTHLCIMELKDENVKSEPAKDVIKQALIYSAFIRELLRSESGERWWELFGFHGKIPAKLVLYAVCVLPSGIYNDTSFKNELVPLGGEDVAMLHYIYFTESENSIIAIDASL